VPEDKFQETFGEKWSDVLKEGRGVNAMEACKLHIAYFTIISSHYHHTPHINSSYLTSAFLSHAFAQAKSSNAPQKNSMPPGKQPRSSNSEEDSTAVWYPSRAKLPCMYSMHSSWS
jgi:hypothetical protein